VASSPPTREIQFDEKWSLVGKQPKDCDPKDPADDHRGDYWDYVAYDPEHRLVLAVISGGAANGDRSLLRAAYVAVKAPEARAVRERA
jgi:hypothetical protein